jgi:hypothetical protein
MQIGKMIAQEVRAAPGTTNKLLRSHRNTRLIPMSDSTRPSATEQA